MTFQVPFIRKIGVIAVLVAALGLAACGRKGALDAPASAQAAGEEDKTSVEHKGTAAGLPTIKGAKKRIPLDALLD